MKKKQLTPLERITVSAMDSVAFLTATIPQEGSKGVSKEIESPIVSVFGRLFQFERKMAVGEAMDLDTAEFVNLDLTKVM